jgi:hypothetical protein
MMAPRPSLASEFAVVGRVGSSAFENFTMACPTKGRFTHSISLHKEFTMIAGWLRPRLTMSCISQTCLIRVRV